MAGMTVKPRILCRDCHRRLTDHEVARLAMYHGRCAGCCTARMEHDAARQVARHGVAVRYSE